MKLKRPKVHSPHLSTARRTCRADEIRKAEEMVRRFSHRKIAGYRDLAMTWPERPALFGEAVAIGYRSNKFDGLWRDYIHHHDAPLPSIIKELGRGDEPYIGEPLSPPRSLAILGFALDLQYQQHPDDLPQHIDWKDEPYLPFLCGCPKSQKLIIVPQCGGYPLILESPVLEIRAEGIVH